MMDDANPGVSGEIARLSVNDRKGRVLIHAIFAPGYIGITFVLMRHHNLSVSDLPHLAALFTFFAFMHLLALRCLVLHNPRDILI